MIPQAIQDSETALRRAVEQKYFSRVEKLTLSHCELVDSHLSTLPVGDALRLELLTRVIGVLQWTRLMLATARSGHSERLRQALMAKRYFASAGTSQSQVQVDF
ncbi:MAG: hypothetical protein ABSG41_14890 [Bryobacteraceae bacterium]|jgi:hypothetical protein